MRAKFIYTGSRLNGLDRSVEFYTKTLRTVVHVPEVRGLRRAEVRKEGRKISVTELYMIGISVRTL